MTSEASEVRDTLAGRTVWLWHYMHADWQWEQSRHWHEERYALAVNMALDLMHQDPEFCYYFDTASELFSAVAQQMGDRMEELRARVREGRIRVVSAQVANTRPTQVGGAETYIRNLQLGRVYFEQHLPPTDTSLFHSVDIAIGHVQMPQLLTLAGFKYYKAWRPHGPMNALGIPPGQGGEVTVTFDWSPQTVQAVDLLGQPLDASVSLDGQTVSLHLCPWQIITLRFN